MALSTVPQALAQYNANLGWQSSEASAQLALEAVRYLLVNRAQRREDQGSTLDYASLETEKAALQQFLGATAPRAFGRSRVNSARFCGSGGIQ